MRSPLTAAPESPPVSHPAFPPPRASRRLSLPSRPTARFRLPLSHALQALLRVGRGQRNGRNERPAAHVRIIAPSGWERSRTKLRSPSLGAFRFVSGTVYALQRSPSSPVPQSLRPSALPLFGSFLAREKGNRRVAGASLLSLPGAGPGERRHCGPGVRMGLGIRKTFPNRRDAPFSGR
jgi:hypothetical protein